MAASIASTQPLRHHGFIDWLPDFLRSELAPYPGRVSAVLRITISVVITLILAVTFRIPGTAITLYAVFLIARDSPTTAVKSAAVNIGANFLGLAATLLGVWLFVDYRLLFLIYLLLEFFILFWLVRVMVQTVAALNMGVAVYSAALFWTLPYPANVHTEDTLWAFISLTLGSVVAAVVEIFLVRVDPVQVLISGVEERLQAVHDLLSAWSQADNANRAAAAKRIENFAIVGTGRLRRQLRAIENGHAHFRQYLAELNSAIALTGRLIDVAANAPLVAGELSESTRMRTALLAKELDAVRARIALRQRPDVGEQSPHPPAPDLPVLPELEKTTRMIAQAFSPAQTENAAVASDIDEEPKTRWIVADAFTNPEYVRFALRGCLAVVICYIIYTAIDWPGIATSVLTAFITALSTIGASKQKQILRITGATFGGLIAILALVFILPSTDRITGVALLTGVVTAGGAWITSSSPRLSYFGLQTLLAFYITVLQDYSTPLSLAPARDRFVGVLLGLTVTWVIGDTLWPVHAVTAMRQTLRQNIRLLAQLVGVLDNVRGDRSKAIPEVRRLRELTNTGFQAVQDNAATVLYEFGPDRARQLAERDEVLGIQASVRTLFLLEMAILQYRLQLNTKDIPEGALAAQNAFTKVVEQRLLELAGDRPKTSADTARSEEQIVESTLEREVQQWRSEAEREWVTVRAQGILSLSKQFLAVLDGVQPVV